MAVCVFPTPQVCECVVILRNVKDVSWAGAKAMMADGNFLKSLLEFDKDSLTDKQVKRVKEYLRDKDFNYENLQVCTGLKRSGAYVRIHNALCLGAACPNGVNVMRLRSLATRHLLGQRAC